MEAQAAEAAESNYCGASSPNLVEYTSSRAGADFSPRTTLNTPSATQTPSTRESSKQTEAGRTDSKRSGGRPDSARRAASTPLDAPVQCDSTRSPIPRLSGRERISWLSDGSKLGVESNKLSSEASWSTSRQSLEQMVSISGTEMLRGVRLPEVMKNFAGLFASNKGTSASYALSSTTHCIDEFLSHNWSVGRADKFLALSVHYHAAWAVLAAWTVGAISAGLTIAGYLPWFDLGPYHSQSLSAWISGHIAFVLVFLFAQDLRRLFCCCCPSRWLRPRMVFLDKVCIDQTDAAVQRKGIENLAGFLNMSRTMVVIYSKVYLQRLWTVYELASFMLLHQDASRISVLPIYWVRHFVLYILFLYVLTAFYRVVHIVTVSRGLHAWLPSGVYLLIGFAVGLCWTVTGRRGQRNLQEEEARIRSFSIRKAVCAVEADRKLVEGNICRFMRTLEWVSSEDPEEALDLFDESVRTEMPLCLKGSVRGNGYPYWMCVAVNMTFVLFGLDSLAVEIAIGSAVLTVAAKVLYNVMMGVAIVPLGLGLAHCVLSQKLHWRSYCAEAVVCVLALVPGILLFMVEYGLMSVVVVATDEALVRDAFIVMVVYSASLLFFTGLFYTPLPEINLNLPRFRRGKGATSTGAKACFDGDLEPTATGQSSASDASHPTSPRTPAASDITSSNALHSMGAGASPTSSALLLSSGSPESVLMLSSGSLMGSMLGGMTAYWRRGSDRRPECTCETGCQCEAKRWRGTGHEVEQPPRAQHPRFLATATSHLSWPVEGDHAVHDCCCAWPPTLSV